MRNDALLRVLRLMAALRYPRTLEELAEMLHVTTRTVRRDIDTLKAVNVRVWRAEQSQTYQLSRPDARIVDLAPEHEWEQV